MEVALARADQGWHVAVLNEGQEPTTEHIGDLASVVAEYETRRPRWVWQDTRAVLPGLLEAGVTVERARDLRLCHRLLADAGLLERDESWARSLGAEDAGLFQLGTKPFPIDAVIAEHRRQTAATADSRALSLLLGAESSGAIIAAELLHTGLPWSSARHNALLTEALGPRPAYGRPSKMQALAAQMSELLDEQVNPDSPADMLRALRARGLTLQSTARWELRTVEHPVIEPFIAYKKLARLWSANGWAWADQWVREGRFHAEYVPGGVVTGRWATTGAGAMQIAKDVRGAIMADEGWSLIVADAAQLEPRVLAAIARDDALSYAARGDLYDGLVTAGVADSRSRAKIAMLGALYGSTTGESGRLVPQLRRRFPKAMAVVDNAATAGERGFQVRSWLGRTSPPARDFQGDQGRARAWGRFTRNFVVQSTAAEWALTWMALLRKSLRASGGELVYFLHDEVIVHAPKERAEAVRQEIIDAAAGAARLLFGDVPVTFPVDARIVHNYGQAND